MEYWKRLFTNPSERDIQDVRESCPAHMLTHGVMGLAFGGFAGLFLASMSSAGGPESLSPGVQTVRQAVAELVSRTWASAKSFAKIGALFAGSECVVEAARGRHDRWNGLAAGCFTGGVLGRAGGPASAAAGCIGFAAFSTAIDTVLNRPKYSDDDYRANE